MANPNFQANGNGAKVKKNGVNLTSEILAKVKSTVMSYDHLDQDSQWKTCLQEGWAEVKTWVHNLKEREKKDALLNIEADYQQAKRQRGNLHRSLEVNEGQRDKVFQKIAVAGAVEDHNSHWKMEIGAYGIVYLMMMFSGMMMFAKTFEAAFPAYDPWLGYLAALPCTVMYSFLISMALGYVEDYKWRRVIILGNVALGLVAMVSATTVMSILKGMNMTPVDQFFQEPANGTSQLFDWEAMGLFLIAFAELSGAGAVGAHIKETFNANKDNNLASLEKRYRSLSDKIGAINKELKKLDEVVYKRNQIVERIDDELAKLVPEVEASFVHTAKERREAHRAKKDHLDQVAEANRKIEEAQKELDFLTAAS
ncbi:MAG: hypothetical protein HOC09_22060 [Deltaproteobacteria bacterium]|nr:hypothetical protein [Deltaproteobacteria bacterium]